MVATKTLRTTEPTRHKGKAVDTLLVTDLLLPKSLGYSRIDTFSFSDTILKNSKLFHLWSVNCLQKQNFDRCFQPTINHVVTWGIIWLNTQFILPKYSSFKMIVKRRIFLSAHYCSALFLSFKLLKRSLLCRQVYTCKRILTGLSVLTLLETTWLL